MSFAVAEECDGYRLHQNVDREPCHSMAEFQRCHNPDADAVADALISRSLMPESARLDAMHVAIAALAGVQYLLTQNCTHIANARVLPRVYQLLNELGLTGLLIATPIEFLGGADDDESDS